MKNELFILAPQTLAAMDAETIDHTVHDMCELGIFNLPYPKVDVMIYVEVPREFTIPAGTSTEIIDDVISGKRQALVWSKTETCLTVCFIGLRALEEGLFTCDYLRLEGRPPNFRPFNDIRQHVKESHLRTCTSLGRALIVALASRNVEKTVKVNKLAKLGIGPKTAYPRVTTISVSKNLSTDSEHATEGKPKAPHLRRGHIRRQHYGPHNAYLKQIWIEPVFVNADSDFVSQRKAYNLSL